MFLRVVSLYVSVETVSGVCLLARCVSLMSYMQQYQRIYSVSHFGHLTSFGRCSVRQVYCRFANHETSLVMGHVLLVVLSE